MQGVAISGLQGDSAGQGMAACQVGANRGDWFAPWIERVKIGGSASQGRVPAVQACNQGEIHSCSWHDPCRETVLTALEVESLYNYCTRFQIIVTMLRDTLT